MSVASFERLSLKSRVPFLMAYLVAILGSSMRVQAQSTPDAWERMLTSKKMVDDYLIRIARQVTDQAAEEMGSQAPWEKVREQRRLELLEMLGLYPLPSRTPLKVQVTGTIDKGDYTIEKIAFESLPKIYVTTNLYIPKEHSRPLPTVIYVCGHSFSPQGSKVMYQRHPITFAKQGYVCMIIDPIQIAETFALHHGVFNQEMYDWYARGYTPAGVEVWNVMRALDYLETRPEVDENRFGITGRSGGAAISWFSAAVDPRLKVAVPVMGNSTYAANVAANTQKGHCDCMFPINTFLQDLMTQGALIAPRPLYMMHGKKDTLFPVPGYEEFAVKVGNLYRAYGVAEKFKNLVVDTGHADSDLLREEAVRWFDRYLKEIPDRKIDLSYENEQSESLAVFGGKPPADAQNFRIHETLTAAPLRGNYNGLGAWKARRLDLINRLKEKVFRAFPKDKPDLKISSLDTSSFQGFRELQFTSEEGITLRALYKGPAAVENPKWPGLIYVASDAEDVEAIRQMLRQVLDHQKAVLIMYPRGVGEVPWEKTAWKHVLRNSMHLGRTVDSMRLWDVLQSVEVLKRQPALDTTRITLLGKGISGVLGLYGAILDETIHQVILIDPPTSHLQGPTFLNILRYTDLPEAAALLAPRRLIFYGRVPKDYQYTQTIYRLFGEPGLMSLSMSINGVLDGRYGHDFTAGY